MNNVNSAPTDTPQPIMKSNSRRLKFGSRGIILLILILAIVVGGAVWYLYIRDEAKVKPPLQTPSTYSYDSELGTKNQIMATHLLQGSGQTTGMLFKLPLNGVVYTDSPLDQPDTRLRPQSLSDIITDKGNNVEFGNRFVAPSGTIAFQSLIAAKTVLPAEQAEFDAYNYFRDLLAKWSFNISKDTSQLGFGMSPAKVFNNSAITSGGQVYDISVSLPNGDNSGVIDHMVGQIIEIKGQNANYYLLISAIDENWHSSSKTWQIIKDSIEVDQ